MAGLHHLADQVDMFFVLLGKWFRLWIFSSKDTLAERGYQSLCCEVSPCQPLLAVTKAKEKTETKEVPKKERTKQKTRPERRKQPLRHRKEQSRQ